MADRSRQLMKILRRKDRGAAIIEFALLAPVLIIILCGLGDFGITIFARTLTANAAQGLADLATQYPKMQTSDMVNFYNAAYSMMQPLSSANLTLRITNVASNGNGGALVYWSCGQGSLPPFAAKSSVSTTSTGSPVSNVLLLYNFNYSGFNFVGQDTTFVMVEAVNQIPSPTQVVLQTTQVMSAEGLALPRTATYVGFPWDGNSSHIPGVPSSTSSTGQVSLSTNRSSFTCNYSS